MKKMVILMLFSLMVVSTGCMSHNVNTASAPLHVDLKSNELKADVVVGGKISGQASVTYILGLVAIGGTNKYADGVLYDGHYSHKSLGLFSFYNILSGAVDKAKASAAYDAISKSNADVIISPRYIIDEQDYFLFKNVSAQVTGYKGTINSIK